MKKIVMGIMLVAASAVGAYAQSGARFEFKDKNDTYDFGTAKDGTKVVHVYEFKNTGDQPLQILKAEASCGCTTPEWTRTPVLPGKTGTVKVTFNTEGRVGPAIKEINIQSNAVQADKSKERYVLTLKGTVAPK